MTPVELDANDGDYTRASYLSSSYTIKSITVAGWTMIALNGQAAQAMTGGNEYVIATIPASTVNVIGYSVVVTVGKHNSHLA